MILKHLVFLGPTKQSSILNFQNGLNVLYGASETGKSFVVEAIDFMLGGSDPLRDIPERIGYNTILLGILTNKSGEITLQRSTDGGNFVYYRGLHTSIPQGQKAEILNERHKNDSDDNLSNFLLSQIDLNNKVIKRSASKTRSLSFRDLARLCIIEETQIQKTSSPIESNQYVLKTSEFSVFKLLINGVDDSSFVGEIETMKSNKERGRDLVVLEEWISGLRKKITNQSADIEQARIELEKVTQAIDQERESLSGTDDQMNDLISTKDNAIKKLTSAQDRVGEIEELFGRFELLDKHYDSDLRRLEALRESGSLIDALSKGTCPLCGSDPEHHQLHLECDGNLELVVEASQAESTKIKSLKSELSQTILQLKIEHVQYLELIPTLEFLVYDVTKQIDTLKQVLKIYRNRYAELVDKKSDLIYSLSILEQIDVLQKLKSESKIEGNIIDDDVPNQQIAISTSTLDEFSQAFEKVLQAWNFPEANRVSFDEKKRDLIIAGKLRTSRGKGLRSITHAAFTISLMEFCHAHELPHPGFVVIDSPLLAYREPESAEDDLSSTDVQDKFYRYLKNLESGQVIVIENLTPPKEILSMPSITMFSKNGDVGRYGLFPR